MTYFGPGSRFGRLPQEPAVIQPGTQTQSPRQSDGLLEHAEHDGARRPPQLNGAAAVEPCAQSCVLPFPVGICGVREAIRCARVIRGHVGHSERLQAGPTRRHPRSSARPRDPVASLCEKAVNSRSPARNFSLRTLSSRVDEIRDSFLTRLGRSFFSDYPRESFATWLPRYTSSPLSPDIRASDQHGR